jgi:hypothetical protein
LRVDEADDLAAHGQIVQVWKARTDNPFHGELRQDGELYWFSTSDAGLYRIDPKTPSITMTTGQDALRREMRLFGVPAAICLSELGDISIHASAVDIGGHAVLLAGPSRYGKTTLAAALTQAGHRLLSEDSIRCGVAGRALVWPGPAAVRLRSDVASGLRIPGARVVVRDKGRVALIIDEPFRGDGHPVPLGAIVILHPGEATEPPRLEPAAPAAAIRDLLALTFHLPGASGRATSFSRITDLVALAPTFNLYRPMTIESLDEVRTLLEGQVVGMTSNPG